MKTEIEILSARYVALTGRYDSLDGNKKERPFWRSGDKGGERKLMKGRKS